MFREKGGFTPYYNKSCSAGFTLIEMLVVIAMIGILSAVVLTALGPSRDKAKDARIISDVNQARAIAEGYYNPTSGTYPAGTIQSALTATISDADSNYGYTKGCGSHALCIVPASGDTSNFAIYGELNIGHPDTWFCSDSNGKTEQTVIPAVDPSGSPTTYDVCP